MLRLPHPRLALAIPLLALCLAAQDKPPASLTAEEVLDKSVDAQGGRAALENVDSLVEKATLLGDVYALDPYHFSSSMHEPGEPEASGTYESYWKAPGKRVVLVTEQGALESAIGFDGSAGWSCWPGAGCRDWKIKSPAQEDWTRSFPGALHWRDLYSKIELRGTQEISGHKVYVLRLTPKQGPARLTYYDAETFLPRRTEIFWSVGADSGMWSVDFSNYYRAGGIQFPMVITYHKVEMKGNNSHQLVLRVTYIAINKQIADEVFAKPARKK